VDVVYDDFGAVTWSFLWGRVWEMSGASIPFSLEIPFNYLNRDSSIVTCFLDVADLYDSHPSIDRGIGD
jgi:hypothetical protein